MSFDPANSDPRPIRRADFEAVIGRDFTRPPAKFPYPADGPIIHEHGKGHQGLELHRFTVDHVPDVFRLVIDDNDDGVNDHEYGTFSDDYETISELFNSIANPHPGIERIARFVICRPDSQILGRVDVDPDLSTKVGHVADVAIWVANPFREQGIAKHVLSRLMGHYFAEYDSLKEIRIETVLGVHGARMLVESLKFRKHGLVQPFGDNFPGTDELHVQEYVMTRPRFTH